MDSLNRLEELLTEYRSIVELDVKPENPKVAKRLLKVIEPLEKRFRIVQAQLEAASSDAEVVEELDF
jgi:hypothetical protein